MIRQQVLSQYVGQEAKHFEHERERPLLEGLDVFVHCHVRHALNPVDPLTATFVLSELTRLYVSIDCFVLDWSDHLFLGPWFF